MLQNTSQGHKAQESPTCDPGTNNSTNYKSTTSYDQNTKSGLQPPLLLLTLPTQHTTRHSRCPLTNSLPHPTSSHHPSDYRSTVPLSPTTPCYPLYNQPILNPFSIPSSSSNICTRTTNTLSYFSPHCHPISFPHPTPEYPVGYQRTTQRGTTANDHNIFLSEVMHNVQQQLNNMMAVMSPTQTSWGKPTYTQ